MGDEPFYLSGFHLIYKSLENTEKIRILIGIGTSKSTYDLLSEATQSHLSHFETKELTSKMIEDEMAESDDKPEIEKGVQKFIEWVKSKKLEVQAYPSQDIHAKVYIMTFKEGDRDVGRVITGSSNFTKSGLLDNLEFNVELKNRADYEFAQQKFSELWENAVDVSERFVQTIIEKTWLNNNITPLLYLKKGIKPLEEQSQKNLGGFMKVLLVKRQESSFYAFRKSIERFIYSYEMFIQEYEKGNVYISKKHINKIFELLEKGDDEAIQKLIDEGKAERYNSSEFRKEFLDDLRNDLEILKEIKSRWKTIKRDPKVETLIKNLKTNAKLKKAKIIIFTESKETAEYLIEKINHELENTALLFHVSARANL